MVSELPDNVVSLLTWWKRLREEDIAVYNVALWSQFHTAGRKERSGDDRQRRSFDVAWHRAMRLLVLSDLIRSYYESCTWLTQQGHKIASQPKIQGWKIGDMKMRHYWAGAENATHGITELRDRKYRDGKYGKRSYGMPKEHLVVLWNRNLLTSFKCHTYRYM